jgi:uncharacterized membrane protein YhhN
VLYGLFWKGKLAERKRNDFLVPVMAYLVVIFVMFLCALNYDYTLGPNTPYASIGAFLFILSDSFIAINKFALRTPSHLLEVLILSTYFPAQALVAKGTLNF